jgi:hypothetical protein
MIGSVLLGLLIVVEAPAGGQAPAAEKSRSERKGAAATEAELAALAEYNARRLQVRRTAESHMTLAQWCHDRGLRAEAVVHASIAIELDPRKEGPWRLLGYQKVDGRWLTPEQAREEAEQKKADREWAPKLASLHKALHGPRKKAKAAALQQAREAREARDTLSGIEAPRAVPAIYREFAQGSPTDQEIAVQIFGQIAGPAASKGLAALSIYGTTPEVRRKATETLRGREPGDYVGAMIGLLATPLKYEIRPDGATRFSRSGSLGALAIEGEHHILERNYVGITSFEAEQTPDLTVRPGDYITYDRDGFPVIHRPGGRSVSARRVAEQYENAAIAARTRLERDIAQLKAENAARKEFNDIVFRVLKFATGADVAAEKRAWKDWLADRQGVPREEPVREHKITYFQLVKPYAAVMPGNETMAFLNRPYETLPFT